MNILIIGAGGREHAIAWKVLQSPRLRQLYITPGNAGTATLSQLVKNDSAITIANLAIPEDDTTTLLDFAQKNAINVVIIGGEGPLAKGLSDAFHAVGIAVFGPSRNAAQIESSKAFAKAFMVRHQIPTARFATFSELDKALQHLHQVDYPVVIKASGLAAGKGVILPESLAEAEAVLRRMMLEHSLGNAGNEVVIEERLWGEEVSLLAFSDGMTVKVMPPTRDHKRLRDNDQGPNTGGMGAYAPAQNCPPALCEELTQNVLQRTIDGLRAENMPFIGVLYAGIILTADGPKVLEFNCRFGDPETQVLLPLLETDFIDIAQACINQTLADCPIKWKNTAAACIILASEGYPHHYTTGYPITGLDKLPPNTFAFHAGTRQVEGQIVTAGGRVLGITGWGKTLDAALQAAYASVDIVHFTGLHCRRDIGRAIGLDHSATTTLTNTLANTGTPAAHTDFYGAAGVDIKAGNRAIKLMTDAVRSTYGPEVLAGIGAFGGMFHAKHLKEMNDPVLVASTDGVGTKVHLAVQAGRYRSLGYDIVNHSVNDILVQGARPLFFLDYVACNKLDPEIVASVVSGMAAACRESGCALLGGETAEMPGVYLPQLMDVAGTIVGIVERNQVLPRHTLQADDVLIGIASSGPHTNGYSLIRDVFNDIPLDTVLPELKVSLADCLLAPHRSYLQLLNPVLHHATAPIKALVHITGGGFFENIPRVLPQNLGAIVQRSSWPVPPLFQLIQQKKSVTTDEMYRVFNMGIGMIAITSTAHVALLQSLIPEQTWVIGKLVSGERQVTLL